LKQGATLDPATSGKCDRPIHIVPLVKIDPDFAWSKPALSLRNEYLHPNRQTPSDLRSKLAPACSARSRLFIYARLAICGLAIFSWERYILDAHCLGADLSPG
jgi:hypothetical protein